MGIVKEDINFERGKDPKTSLDVGKNSRYSREQILEKIKNKGIRFRFTNDPEKENLLDKIYEVEKVINKLGYLNVPIKSVTSVFGISIEIEIHEILDSNRVILYCFSEEDANNLIKILKMGAFHNYDNFSTEKSTTSLDITYDVLEWLDKFEENREKIKKALS